MIAEIDNKVLEWLLKPDDINARYLAMRDLMTGNQKELQAARKKAHGEGYIDGILSKMDKEGYWERPGSGYFPKYSGTIWSIILLSQLGADLHTDRRIEKACNYIVEHSLMGNGQFTINGLPSGTVDCLQGNLCEALLNIGYENERLDKAIEWMARTVTGEGIASMEEKKAPLRYYSGKCGPNFACGANNKLPCAWGAAKVMVAFSKLPRNKRTPMVKRAIQAGVDFLFSRDPAKADYPSGYNSKPSGNWWKIGFPVFYITDILQIAEALTGLGYGHDPRLANALKLIRDKQDGSGRWLLEYEYRGKTWIDFGPKKIPNKYVTIRALKVLRNTG